MSLTDCLFGCKYSCLTFIFALNVRVKSYVMQKRRTTLTDIIKSPHVFIWRLSSHLVYPLLFQCVFKSHEAFNLFKITTNISACNKTNITLVDNAAVTDHRICRCMKAYGATQFSIHIRSIVCLMYYGLCGLPATLT